MTDNEIIKELQEEIHLIEYVCGSHSEHASLEMLKGCLNLINRQKAEIARLRAVQGSIDNFARDLCKERLLKSKAIADFEDLQEYIRKEKSKVIREFAEKLKERNEDFCVDKSDMAFVVNSIVKEMTEDENG